MKLYEIMLLPPKEAAAEEEKENFHNIPPSHSFSSFFEGAHTRNRFCFIIIVIFYLFFSLLMLPKLPPFSSIHQMKENVQ